MLAGDHLKAANDLGLPLTGVGLFYRHGYFRQQLDRRGWQQERFPRLDPRAMALTPVPDTRVSVELAGVRVHARAVAGPGRAHLALPARHRHRRERRRRAASSATASTAAASRSASARRSCSASAACGRCEAVGKLPEVFHINEGHAGFLALERIRRAMLDDGLSFAEAKAAVRPGAVFTTHTPVPAGIDRFPRELMEKYFSNWCRDVGLTLDDLMALGHEPGTEPRARCSTWRPSACAWPGRATACRPCTARSAGRCSPASGPTCRSTRCPISSVTNGVHARTWTTPEMADALRAGHRRRLARGAGRGLEGHRGRPRTASCGRPGATAASASCSTPAAACATRRVQRGASESQLAWTDDVLDPAALTIGFARRFATYKRATLLFRDLDRLKALLLDEERPVQLVFAGKAHPADDLGKELLRQVAQVAADLDLRHRLVLLEDYDITVARMLVGRRRRVAEHARCDRSRPAAPRA